MALVGFDGLRLELRGQGQERQDVQILVRPLALDSLYFARQLHVEDARIGLHVDVDLTKNENDYTLVRLESRLKDGDKTLHIQPELNLLTIKFRTLATITSSGANHPAQEERGQRANEA